MKERKPGERKIKLFCEREKTLGKEKETVWRDGKSEERENLNFAGNEKIPCKWRASCNIVTEMKEKNQRIRHENARGIRSVLLQSAQKKTGRICLGNMKKARKTSVFGL